MRKSILNILLFVLFSFFLNKDVFPWNDGVTHKDFSEYAAENSVLSEGKGDYLRNLGFNMGLDEVLTWQEKDYTVTKWLREGGELEDSATILETICGHARFNNHFHNPIKQWESAGLDDYVLNLCPPLIPPLRNVTGESSLLWAQDATQQGSHPTEGDWSWAKVRQVYYWALISTTDTLRQVNFAQTFKGLGHQMHLIQDSVQPDHVRNDAHPEDAVFGKNILNGSRYFETWAKERFRNLNELKAFVPNPIFPVISFSSDDGYIPISRLIDTKQYYNGGIPSTSLTQGIAEYANAIFSVMIQSSRQRDIRQIIDIISLFLEKEARICRVLLLKRNPPRLLSTRMEILKPVYGSARDQTAKL